jgi:hypothetical protein
VDSLIDRIIEPVLGHAGEMSLSQRDVQMDGGVRSSAVGRTAEAEAECESGRCRDRMGSDAIRHAESSSTSAGW